MKNTKELNQRIQSIDVFRGLTIFLMIFVNDLASVKNMPQWLKHMPENVDGMTFVDVVFPAFLFIVGMAIPFAVNKRLNNNESFFKIWKHILSRTASLLILGIMMVNTSNVNESAMGIDKNVWLLLVLIGAILIWNQYPRLAGKKNKTLFFSLRLSGIILIAFLALIFRGGTEGNLTWLQTKWWGILGLIGWAYLASCCVYIIFSKNFYAIASAVIIFIVIYIFDGAGFLNFLSPIKKYLLIGEHIGVHGAITIAGMSISMLFIKTSKVNSSYDRMKYIILFSLVLFALGRILQPFYGISKIHATPTWGLYSAAYCGWIFAFLYWIIDVKNKVKWAKFLEPAGRNPLLAYLLPDIFYSIIWILGITFFTQYLGEGIIGIFRSLIFAYIFVLLTSYLNKINIRLHL